MMVKNIKKQRLFEQMSNHDVYCGLFLIIYKKWVTYSMNKMEAFSLKLGMIKWLEIRQFSTDFHSESEFWHCHFTGNKLEASNKVFLAK